MNQEELFIVSKWICNSLERISVIVFLFCERKSECESPQESQEEHENKGCEK